MRIALGIEYDGHLYYGWQAQEGLLTVQGQLQTALSIIANEPIQVFCAGRTDAGVHATGQVIHFETNAQRAVHAWTLGTNSHLPSSIAVRWVKAVDDNFHARFTATARCYRYVIYNHQLRPAILAGRTTWYQRPLDITVMQQASSALLGEQDFTSFRSSQCESRTPMRNVHKVEVTRHGNLVIIEIAANAFLHHMVRNIAGVLMHIGARLVPPSAMQEILAAKDRKQAFETAAPSGLYLTDVTYPDHYEIPQTENLYFI
jgi:tRNA pseudouridine38-40 synthase